MPNAVGRLSVAGAAIGLCRVSGRLWLRRAEERFERGELLVVGEFCSAGVHVGIELLGAVAGLHRLGDNVLLPLLVVRAYEDRRVADVLPRCPVALDEAFEDREVAPDLLLLRMADQVPDARLLLLPVPVDAAIALLELQ